MIYFNYFFVLETPPEKTMTFLFKEINEKILRFTHEERKEITKHYIEVSVKKLSSSKTMFDHKKLMLLLNILQYAKNKESKEALIALGLASKISSTRALVLDLIDIDFSREQKVFCRPDKWIDIVMKDILETFDYVNLLNEGVLKEKQGVDKMEITQEKLSNAPEMVVHNEEGSKIKISDLDFEATEFKDVYNSEDLMLCLNIYNKKLCNEFVNIFCSCDKFNSSGNQLVLNLVAYIDKMSFLDYDFNALLKKIKSNFKEEKEINIETIIKCYMTYKHDKKNKKKEPGSSISIAQNKKSN